MSFAITVGDYELAELSPDRLGSRPAEGDFSDRVPFGDDTVFRHDDHSVQCRLKNRKSGQRATRRFEFPFGADRHRLGMVHRSRSATPGHATMALDYPMPIGRPRVKDKAHEPRGESFPQLKARRRTLAAYRHSLDGICVQVTVRAPRTYCGGGAGHAAPAARASVRTGCRRCWRRRRR